MLEMKGRADIDQGNSFEIAANVADAISSAQTLEEVMMAAKRGPEDLSEFVGKSFGVVGSSLRWAESAEQFREGGVGLYAIFDFVTTDGVKHTVSTGATNVIFQLRQMERLGVFDGEDVSQTAFTIMSRPTRNGTLYRIDFA
jgi:hypothetical protein